MAQPSRNAENEASQEAPDGDASHRLEDIIEDAFAGDADSWRTAVERLERRRSILRTEAVSDAEEENDAADADQATGELPAETAESGSPQSRAGGSGTTPNARPESGLGEEVSLPEHELLRLRRIVEDLPPGRWHELPGNPMDVVITRADALRISEGDEDAADRLWGWGGPKEIFDAWTSAAFDGRRLYFFGGGHHHYRGNEIVVYDLATLKWKRLYDPSYVTTQTHTGPRRYVPRHGPRAVHAYDGFLYSPLDNAIYMWGARSRHPWRFDISLFERMGDPWQAWQPLDWPEGIKPSQHKTALRPDGKIVVMGGVGRTWKAVFDPRSGTYDHVGRAVAPTSIMVWRDANDGLYVVKEKHLDLYDANGERLKRNVTRIPDAYRGDARESGVAYDTRRDRFVFWPGGREIWVWQPDEDLWVQHANTDGPSPGEGAARIYGKWFYLPRLDAFVGLRNEEHSVWVYKVPETAEANPTLAQRRREGYTCSDEVHGWTCPDLETQIATGTVQKGVYLQCAKIRNRQVDFQGSLVKDRVCGRKAAFIVEGETRIENVTIEAASTNVNAACFRWQGGNLVLRNVDCRGGDMGLLGGGESLRIEDSRIGGTTDSGRNLGHVVYVTKARRVVIRNTEISDPGNRGHVLKTGARETIIENSTIAGGERPYSRVIDAFNGGRLVLRDTRLAVGSGRENAHLIGFGAEQRERFDRHEIRIEGGVVDCSEAFVSKVIRFSPDKTGPVPVTWAPGEVKDCPAEGLPQPGQTAQMP